MTLREQIRSVREPGRVKVPPVMRCEVEHHGVKQPQSLRPQHPLRELPYDRHMKHVGRLTAGFASLVVIACAYAVYHGKDMQRRNDASGAPTFDAVGWTLLGIGVLGLVVLLGVWWVVCLVECLKTPDQQWANAGQNKTVFVLLLVFLGWFGALLYMVIARPAIASHSMTPVAA